MAPDFPTTDALTATRYEVEVSKDTKIEVWRVACDEKGHAEKNRPAVIHVHGGGFVAGGIKGDVSPKTFGTDQYPAGWLQETGIVCLYVKYRLANDKPPTVSFPDLPKDVYSAIKWANANAEKIGINPARISLVGISAGGCLALQAALMARGNKQIQPLFKLVLVYPMLDPGADWIEFKDRPSANENETYKQFLKRGWETYLQPGWKTCAESKYAIPLEQDLRGLPDMYLVVGKDDPFRQECWRFMERACQQQVSIKFKYYDDERVGHAFEWGYHNSVYPDDLMQEIRRELIARVAFIIDAKENFELKGGRKVVEVDLSNANADVMVRKE